MFSPGMYKMSPKTIRFTQSDASPFFSKGGRVDNLVDNLKNGTLNVNDLPPIQVVERNGKLFSIDNRQLLAYNLAGVDEVPTEIVTLDDINLARRFKARFDPVGGEGNYLVVTPSSGRQAAQELMREYGLIEGIQLGK